MLNFIKDNISLNTKIETKTDVKRFIEFLKVQGEKRQLTDIPPITMDGYVGNFIMDLRKKRLQSLRT